MGQQPKDCSSDSAEALSAWRSSSRFKRGRWRAPTWAHLTGFTNRKTNEIWDTWIVGALSFGRNVHSLLRVAVAADKNKDGIYNDAPAVVLDADSDGHVDAYDLRGYGVASNIVAVPFQISD